MNICLMYNAGKAAGAFQIPAAAMIKAFCKPRIKVGTEWVTKGKAPESFNTLNFLVFETQVRLASRQQEPLVVLPAPSLTESSSG